MTLNASKFFSSVEPLSGLDLAYRFQFNVSLIDNHLDDSFMPLLIRSLHPPEAWDIRDKGENATGIGASVLKFQIGSSLKPKHFCFDRGYGLLTCRLSCLSGMP